MSRLFTSALPILLLTAAAACAHKAPAAPKPMPPDGCATGMSGPTINAGDAIRNAQMEAREAMASRMLSAKIKSTVDDDGRGTRVSTTQEIRGLLNDTVIVEMWTNWNGPSRSSTDREVYAVACPRESGPTGKTKPEVPEWILDVPKKAGELCALGLAGPVMRGTDHESVAAEDGFGALAAAAELEISLHIVDDDTGLSDVTSKSGATERLVEHCRQNASVKERWLDKKGAGPLGLEDTMYVLVCMQR